MKNVKGYRVKIVGDKMPIEHCSIEGWQYPKDMKERMVFMDVDAIYFEYPEPITKEEAMKISGVTEKELVYVPKF